MSTSRTAVSTCRSRLQRQLRAEPRWPIAKRGDHQKPDDAEERDHRVVRDDAVKIAAGSVVAERAARGQHRDCRPAIEATASARASKRDA